MQSKSITLRGKISDRNYDSFSVFEVCLFSFACFQSDTEQFSENGLTFLFLKFCFILKHFLQLGPNKVPGGVFSPLVPTQIYLYGVKNLHKTSPAISSVSLDCQPVQRVVQWERLVNLQYKDVGSLKLKKSKKLVWQVQTDFAELAESCIGLQASVRATKRMFIIAAVDCGFPEKVGHGVVILMNGTSTYESVAAYSCSDPAVLQGTHYRTCEEDGRWEGPIPDCSLDILAQIPAESRQQGVVY